MLGLLIQTKMKKLLLFLFCVIPFAINAQSSYSIVNSVDFHNESCILNKIDIVMPVPQSNNYQTISKLNISSGEVQTTDGSNKYVRDVNTANLPKEGDTYSLRQTYNVSLYPMSIDFNQFKTIYPYDQTSELYKTYTKSDGYYIDTNNATIKGISGNLWLQANGQIIDYARLCYEYVASHFIYTNPNTGIHPIAQILSDGGGDCGNLASIFVNLMRCQGIPARHVVTIRPNGSFHVWNDFYLEKYGWIPLDVNRKLDYPTGNYFGFCMGDGIVTSFDVNHEIEYEEGQTFSADILQNFFFWYWRQNEGDFNINQNIQGTYLPVDISPTIKETRGTSATIGFKNVEGVSYYIVKLYKKTDLHNPIGIYKTDSYSDLQLNGLDYKTDYVIAIALCRKMDNIEAVMNNLLISFTTKEKEYAKSTYVIIPKVQGVTVNPGFGLNLASIGSPFEFTVTPDATLGKEGTDFTIEVRTDKGETLYPTKENCYEITSVDHETTINIIVKKLTTAIDDLDQFSIYGGQGTITIFTPVKANVMIVDMTGNRMNPTIIASGKTVYSGLLKGIYFVRVGNIGKKIMVK